MTNTKIKEIKYRKVAGTAELDKAYRIREHVFIDEQRVDREDEFDEYDEESHQFIAVDNNGTVYGTARWRFTDEGVKLERFAVLKEFRNQGIGCGLIEAILDDIDHEPLSRDQKLYLNAQLAAVPVYQRFGFKPEGPVFLECNIEHQKMSR